MKTCLQYERYFSRLFKQSKCNSKRMEKIFVNVRYNSKHKNKKKQELKKSLTCFNDKSIQQNNTKARHMARTLHNVYN